MISYIDINDKLDPYFYDEFQLGEDELVWLSALSENGEEGAALDVLMEQYINAPSSKYQSLMSRYLSYQDAGVIREKDESKLLRNVALLSFGLSTLLTNNFKAYFENIYGKSVFRDAGLGDKDIQKSILKEVISEYEQYISGAMTQTQSFVINGIRTLQREMITERSRLQSSNLSNSAIESEVSKFKSALRQKYPELYKAMEEGNVLVSRKYGPNQDIVRHYKLDSYIDMTTRTTLLNADRTSNEIVARANDERALEYFLSDPRGVKKDREICQDILHRLVLGKSLLALDDITAAALNIMTVDEARETPDYAMGPYCRHSLRRLSPEYLKLIDDMINKLVGAA